MYLAEFFKIVTHIRQCPQHRPVRPEWFGPRTLSAATSRTLQFIRWSQYRTVPRCQLDQPGVIENIEALTE